MDLKKDGKYLAYLLRHHPEAKGLTMDPCGWVSIDQIVKNCGGRYTKELIVEIVKTDDKGRFAIDKTDSRIRAVQGHSISIDLNLTPEKPPRFLYHGTCIANKPQILSQGLKKMSRQYVHLTTNKNMAYKNGKRYGTPIIFVVDALQAYDDGVLFYKAENGVWLTDYVDSKYIVLCLDQKIILYSSKIFKPDEKFEKKMQEKGYSNYDDTYLRFDADMIKFIEDNAVVKPNGNFYIAQKANVGGKTGIVDTMAWIDYIDTTKKWMIEFASIPFIGAEKITHYNIEEGNLGRIYIQKID